MLARDRNRPNDDHKYLTLTRLAATVKRVSEVVELEEEDKEQVDGNYYRDVDHHYDAHDQSTASSTEKTMRLTVGATIMVLLFDNYICIQRRRRINNTQRRQAQTTLDLT